MSQVTIKTKCVSEDEEFCLEFNLTNEPQMCIDILRISQFILCKYDHFYWLGMICETDVENRDVRVKFMHPPYQSRSYRWPVREVFCWVPNTNVITKIDAPSLCTVTARQYQLSQADIQNTEQLINK